MSNEPENFQYGALNVLGSVVGSYDSGSEGVLIPSIDKSNLGEVNGK